MCIPLVDGALVVGNQGTERVTWAQCDIDVPSSTGVTAGDGAVLVQVEGRGPIGIAGVVVHLGLQDPRRGHRSDSDRRVWTEKQKNYQLRSSAPATKRHALQTTPEAETSAWDGEATI